MELCALRGKREAVRYVSIFTRPRRGGRARSSAGNVQLSDGPNSRSSFCMMSGIDFQRAEPRVPLASVQLLVGEVGEQCGDTLDNSSQCLFVLFCRFDIRRYYRPIELLGRHDGDGLIIFDAPQAPGQATLSSFRVFRVATAHRCCWMTPRMASSTWRSHGLSLSGVAIISSAGLSTAILMNQRGTPGLL